MREGQVVGRPYSAPGGKKGREEGGGGEEGELIVLTIDVGKEEEEISERVLKKKIWDNEGKGSAEGGGSFGGKEKELVQEKRLISSYGRGGNAWKRRVERSGGPSGNRQKGKYPNISEKGPRESIKGAAWEGRERTNRKIGGETLPIGGGCLRERGLRGDLVRGLGGAFISWND